MIKLPSLDDRTFEGFVSEARSLIPSLAPTWTDHNPSDPGIVLLELLAWLSEIVLYRIDQVPERSYRSFLRLLRGGDDLADTPLDLAIRDTIAELREPYRAVTPRDFEQLALERWPTDPARGALPALARASCVAEQSPEMWKGTASEAEGHYTLIVVPSPASANELPPHASDELLAGLAAFFEPRRLLTTKVHVVSYRQLPLKVSAKVYLDAEGPLDVQTHVESELRRYLDPLRGFRGDGWPFGRAIYATDLAALLDATPGVDFVEDVGIELDEAALAAPPRKDGARIVEARLFPDQLPALTGVTPKFYRRRGPRWQAV